jgi:hypothetical protein
MEMSSESAEKSSPLPPETQRQRWAKYGSNVLLMTVLAIVVSGFIVYIVQSHDRRFDLTGQGVNSLKPQTQNVLRDLGSDVRIISLYSKTDMSADTGATGPRPVDKSGYVSDLLDSYRRASSHISTEVIDPSTDKSKVDHLISDLEQRYGKEITNYKQYLDGYQTTEKQLMQLATAEAQKAGALPVDSLGNDKTGQLLRAAISTIQMELTRRLDTAREAVTLGTKDAHPDYKAITSTVKDSLDELSQYEGKIVEIFNQDKADASVPTPIHQYVVDSIPRHEQVQKLAAAEVDKIAKLGELKVNDLERALNVRNPVVVLGKDDWRVLPENQLWPEDANIKMYTDGKSAPTFAGEQQITSAIVGLTQTKKPKIVFLRPGGQPLASAGFPPFLPAGPLSVWAGRMRDANFEVLEKDLSGQWAAQAMQQPQQMPSAPEPDWSAITDAVWVVLDMGGQMQGPEPIAPKLAEHLAQGGSAIILAGPQADNLAAAMAPWGVEIRTNALAIHQQPPAPPGNATQVDQVQELLRQPWVWNVKDYGDADLAAPIRNLDSLFSPLVVVSTTPTKGYTAKTLLPLPTAPQAPASWGETDLTSLEKGEAPTFDPKTDVAAPIAAGATVEKEGGGRLVVLGAASFAFDRYLTLPDPQIAREEYRMVPRFPGNGELATNAAYWCAKMDSMIALSPSALQVARINTLKPWKLEFWRIGVVLVLLPVLVLIAGINVYFSRRD